MKNCAALRTIGASGLVSTPQIRVPAPQLLAAARSVHTHGKRLRARAVAETGSKNVMPIVDGEKAVARSPKILPELGAWHLSIRRTRS